MKILHIINGLETGGAEKLLVDTLPLYAARGITADLLLLNGAPQPFLEELEKTKCCQIFSLGTSSLYHPKYIFQITPFFRKYNILHVHLFPAQYYVALSKLLFGGKVKLVFTEHSSSNRRRNNFWWSRLDLHIYRLYDKVICITPEIKKILIKYTNLNEKKFQVINNGVDLHSIHSAREYDKKQINSSLRDEDKLILQVAAFRIEKDHETLIRAMINLPLQYKLLLVGEGELKEKLIELVRALDLEERVFFLGGRMDIPQLLKSADIVILSSRYEGLSLSSIEGMASGKPFVASDVPGLSELVKGAGILFPFGKEKKLAAEILRLLNDEEYYTKVAKACMIRAQDYDIQKMVEKHITLYTDLLAADKN